MCAVPGAVPAQSRKMAAIRLNAGIPVLQPHNSPTVMHNVQIELTNSLGGKFVMAHHLHVRGIDINLHETATN